MTKFGQLTIKCTIMKFFYLAENCNNLVVKTLVVNSIACIIIHRSL